MICGNLRCSGRPHAATPHQRGGVLRDVGSGTLNCETKQFDLDHPMHTELVNVQSLELGMLHHSRGTQ